MSASPEHTSVDPKVYRDTIGHFATGVAVITTEDETGPQGMTVNSLTSVSLDPTLLLVCLTRGSRTSTAIRSSGAFVVNVLSHRQIDLSNAFARPSEDHFADVEVQTTENGLPALVGNLATVECTVWRTDEGGDHEIVIGEVQACDAEGGDPLVFFSGRYARQIGIDEYPVPNWWA
jgi:flavin reductase (DIM6/NTAB) family NADH-FMN oxidoreductase RutF